jgi:predicted RNA methylase
MPSRTPHIAAEGGKAEMAHETKHTPGPWHIVATDSTTVEIHSARGLVICEVGDTSLEDEANQAVIAAAPDMLEALDDIAAMLRALGGPTPDKCVARALAAIAKATGSAQ